MTKFYLHFVALLMAVFLLVACDPKTSSEIVAKDLAHAMCDKQKECSPGSAFASDICEQGLTLGYGNALKGKPVSTPDYEACLAGFKTHDCTKLQMNTLPPACGKFIKTF